MDLISKENIMAAIEIVRLRQNHPPLTEWQKNTVEMLVNRKNVVNQLPTGCGKTWPLISLPSILDVLRDNLKLDVTKDTRQLLVTFSRSVLLKCNNQRKMYSINDKIIITVFIVNIFLKYVLGFVNVIIIILVLNNFFNYFFLEHFSLVPFQKMESTYCTF